MISVSVCMIVKNEEKVLRRCLDSLAGLYEELVIVDTGSTDSTKEIAGRYTDKVYDLVWTGSFSDARNFAFDKCTCDYIYSVDADEILAGKQVLDEFRPLLQLVVLMVARQPRMDIKMRQKLPRMPRILCSDEFCLRQDANASIGHVLQIADGRCRKIKGPCLLFFHFIHRIHRSAKSPPYTRHPPHAR